MFSVFMLLVVFGSLVNQAMPHFVTQRDLYEVRERPSKAYSWKAFMLANIIVELPWNTLAAVTLFFTYYYPIGLYRNAQFTDTVTERGGLFFAFVCPFTYSLLGPLLIVACRSGNSSCSRRRSRT